MKITFLFLLILTLISQVCFAQKSYVEIENVYSSKKTKGFGVAYYEEQFMDGKIKASAHITGLDNNHLFTYTYNQIGDTFIKSVHWYIIENKYRIPPYEWKYMNSIKKHRQMFTVGFATKDSIVEIYKSRWFRFTKENYASSDYSEIDIFINNSNYKKYLDTTFFETTTYFYINGKLIRRQYSKNDTSFVYTHLLYEYDGKGLMTKTIEINREDTNWIKTYHRDSTDSVAFTVFRWKDFEDSTIIHLDTTVYQYEYGKKFKKISTYKGNPTEEIYNKKGKIISRTKNGKTDLYKYDYKGRLKSFNNQRHVYRRRNVNGKVMLAKNSS